MIVRPLDLTTVHLDKGAHDDPGAVESPVEMCFMEAAAWIAGEPWSDDPECVCTVLATFGRNLNDILPDDRRQSLVPLLPSLLGTRNDGHAETRSYMALDWLIRTYTPAWLDLAGLTADAMALRNLRRIVNVAAAQNASPAVHAARETVATTWDAALGAARDAAWDATQDAIRVAARVAARDATWDATRVAARDATRVAARDAARYVALDAALDAALGAARVAAQDAARGVLTPTVNRLQLSAIELYKSMIAPTVPAGV